VRLEPHEGVDCSAEAPKPRGALLCVGVTVTAAVRLTDDAVATALLPSLARGTDALPTIAAVAALSK
jgi:hypothetical protein